MAQTFNINKYPKTNKYVMLYFHVHQPFRLNEYYSIFDVDTDLNYFGGPAGKDNHTVLNRVANVCYKTAGEMFLDLLNHSGLKISYSFTGTVLEQLEADHPEVLDIYRSMHSTGKMELISETYYHSLAAFYDEHEFIRQVLKQRQKLGQVFGAQPQVFRNTELTYRNDVAEIIRRLGFKGMFAEGWDPILTWRSPNYMYRSKAGSQLGSTAQDAIDHVEPFADPGELKLLLKNYRRSDDVAFRFQLKGWEGYPVTADKFADWIAAEPGYLVNLCMDYETVGEHHRIESGILEFYKHLPDALAKRGIEFVLPSEAVQAFSSEEELSYPYIVSWADAERDLSAWTGNMMQQKSLEAIYRLGKELRQEIEGIQDSEVKEKLLHTWGKLQTSDHYYYMSTKYWGDGDVHRYFSPYDSPYQAYINFVNVLSDFRHYVHQV